MTDDLKPCPFCGSDRVTVRNISDGKQAVCKDCKSTGAPEFNGPDNDAHERARAAWNLRAALKGDGNG